MQEKLRVGLIGYGAVGQQVAHLLADQSSTDVSLVGALVRQPTRLRPPGSPKIVTTLPALLMEQPHVIVELAGHAGLREHGPGVLRAGIDLVLISVGALAEDDLMRDILTAAEEGNSQAKVASGAIGALDVLAAASLGTLTSVIHTMRKPPMTVLSLEEAVGVTSAREIFRGSARQAVSRFPEFLNVAAAIALAGRGFDQTQVRVIADPTVRQSQHEVRAEGTFGTLRFEIENEPIDELGRGAKVVAMSCVRTLLLRRALLAIG